MNGGQRALRLLSRPECGLCEEFLAELRARFEGALEVRVENVDDDPGLRLRWGRLIPVLLADDGRAICVSRFDAAAIEAWLAGAPV